MRAPARQPTLVMMAGLPGTGKTTLAYAAARVLRWPVLDKDLLNTVLLDAGLDQSQAGPLAYELVLTLAHDMVAQQQRSVIVDTAGRQPFILERAQAIARHGHARLKIIQCVAPQAVRTERLGNRIARPSQWVMDQATNGDQERWYAHLPSDTLRLSSDRPLATTLPIALAFLEAES